MEDYKRRDLPLKYKPNPSFPSVFLRSPQSKHAFNVLNLGVCLLIHYLLVSRTLLQECRYCQPQAERFIFVKPPRSLGCLICGFVWLWKVMNENSWGTSPLRQIQFVLVYVITTEIRVEDQDLHKIIRVIRKIKL